MLIDTHCHLADPAYDADRAEVLARAWAAGRRADRRDRRLAASRPSAPLALAADEPRLVGDRRRPPPRRERLDRRGRRLAARARSGDPRWWPPARWASTTTTTTRPRDAQRAAFEAQLALAARGRASRPSSTPARPTRTWPRCSGPTPDVAAILHSFSSGPGLLRAGLDLGHYVSFSGMVTFKNWRLDQAILDTPLDRLLVETDGPYLAPVPHRGKRNEPAFVRQVAERIAAVRGLPVEDLIARDAPRTRRASFGFPTP